MRLSSCLICSWLRSLLCYFIFRFRVLPFIWVSHRQACLPFGHISGTLPKRKRSFLHYWKCDPNLIILINGMEYSVNMYGELGGLRFASSKHLRLVVFSSCACVPECCAMHAFCAGKKNGCVYLFLMMCFRTVVILVNVWLPLFTFHPFMGTTTTTRNTINVFVPYLLQYDNNHGDIRTRYQFQKRWQHEMEWNWYSEGLIHRIHILFILNRHEEATEYPKNYHG